MTGAPYASTIQTLVRNPILAKPAPEREVVRYGEKPRIARITRMNWKEKQIAGEDVD